MRPRSPLSVSSVSLLCQSSLSSSSHRWPKLEITLGRDSISDGITTVSAILKAPIGMRHFQCCQFYMKLYSILILTENMKKSKKHFKALKKSEIVVFPGRILPCKQKKSAIFSTHSHVSDGKIRAVAANWCLVVRTREDTPAALIVYPTLGRCHQHVAQCCENIQSSFRYANSLFGLLLVS